MQGQPNRPILCRIELFYVGLCIYPPPPEQVREQQGWGRGVTGAASVRDGVNLAPKAHTRFWPLQ